MFALSRQLKFGARVLLLLPEVIVACRVSEGGRRRKDASKFSFRSSEHASHPPSRTRR